MAEVAPVTIHEATVGHRHTTGVKPRIRGRRSKEERGVLTLAL
jgi:hypothetical protein